MFLPNTIPLDPLVGLAHRGRRSAKWRSSSSSLTDKAEQQKVVESLFREKYSTAGIRDRALQRKLNEAEQYRQRIQAVVDQQRSGVLRDRMKSTTDQVYDWIANMVTLARRLDTYRIRSDPPARPGHGAEGDRAARSAPEPGEQPARARTDGRDAGIEPSAERGAAGAASRMERADLQLDHSLAALGTVYSQLLLIGSERGGLGPGRAPA